MSHVGWLFIYTCIVTLVVEPHGLPVQATAVSGARPACHPDQPLHVVTIASHAQAYVCTALCSAALNNLTTHVFGWGTTRKQWGVYSKMVAKARMLRDVVHRLPPGEWMMWNDGTDAFFNRDKVAIMTAFCAMNRTLVFSAERFCWPCPPGVWPGSPTPYRYLNSGGFLGRVADVKRFLDAVFQRPVYKWTEGGDQGESQRVFLAHGPDWGVHLDHRQQIWQTMFKARPDFCRQGLQNCVTGSEAAVYHFNGASKRDVPSFLPRLWWYQAKCPTGALVLLGGQQQPLKGLCPHPQPWRHEKWSDPLARPHKVHPPRGRVGVWHP